MINFFTSGAAYSAYGSGITEDVAPESALWGDWVNDVSGDNNVPYAKSIVAIFDLEELPVGITAVITVYEFLGTDINLSDPTFSQYKKVYRVRYAGTLTNTMPVKMTPIMKETTVTIITLKLINPGAIALTGNIYLTVSEV